MRSYSKIILFFFLTLVFLTGCRKGDDFSEIPYLEYQSYMLFQEDRGGGIIADMITLSVYFTDGDGDIGLDETDDEPPLCDTCEFGNNFLISIFSFNGPNIDTLRNDSRIKNITPIGQNKVLEGIIENDIDITSRSSDSLQFEIQLMDRALHSSEKIKTPKIFISYP